MIITLTYSDNTTQEFEMSDEIDPFYWFLGYKQNTDLDVIDVHVEFDNV